MNNVRREKYWQPHGGSGEWCHHRSRFLGASGGSACRDAPLAPDPSGKFLWAYARTGVSPDWLTHVGADGQLPAEFWPRVYDATTEPRLRLQRLRQ